ncbi:MAG: tetratricopeptide repeat protein, partial [Chitinophagales bacterium]
MKNCITALVVLLISLSTNAQDIFEKGMEAYESKNYHLAIGLFTQVIDAEGESEPISTAYNFRGEAYHNLQDYTKAYEDYTKAIEINSEYALAYQNRATLHEHWFDYPKAMPDYDKSIELNPQFELAYFNRASLKWRMKDLEGALADYNKMLTDFNANDTEVIGYVERIKAEMGVVDNSISKSPIEEDPVVD